MERRNLRSKAEHSKCALGPLLSCSLILNETKPNKTTEQRRKTKTRVGIGEKDTDKWSRAKSAKIFPIRDSNPGLPGESRRC